MGGFAGGFAFGMLMGERSGIIVTSIANGIGGTAPGDREEEVEFKTGSWLLCGQPFLRISHTYNLRERSPLTRRTMAPLD